MDVVNNEIALNTIINVQIVLRTLLIIVVKCFLNWNLEWNKNNQI